MMETKIPGIKAKHAIISDACRKKGDVMAFDEVSDRLFAEYIKLARGAWKPGQDAKFHFVLTVEYPIKSEEPE